MAQNKGIKELMILTCECGCGKKVIRTIAASSSCRVRIFRKRCNTSFQSSNVTLQKRNETFQTVNTSFHSSVKRVNDDDTEEITERPLN